MMAARSTVSGTRAPGGSARRVRRYDHDDEDRPADGQQTQQAPGGGGGPCAQPTAKLPLDGRGHSCFGSGAAGGAPS